MAAEQARPAIAVAGVSPARGDAPLKGEGATSRSEWRLGVFHFLARSARMPAEKRCSIGVLSPGGTISSIS